MSRAEPYHSGGVILDPFMGSGTTAIAAMREGRHFIGFELDKGYYDVAMQRIEEERQKLNMAISPQLERGASLEI